MIRFGPAKLGPVNKAIEELERYRELGINACEIAFTYGAYIKKKEDANKIRDAAKRLDIKLSIHSQYWINLNSKEKIKIEQSKQRILECCRIGEELGAYRVVFHPGFMSGMEDEEVYQNIKKAIIDIQDEIKKNKWKIRIAPETTGKVSVFGSYQQIARLAKETGCAFCIDFAHILARDKKVDYLGIKNEFSEFSEWHVHFSGIEYTEKGERKHLKTPVDSWKELLRELPKDKDIVIINESPEMEVDASEGLKLYKEI